MDLGGTGVGAIRHHFPDGNKNGNARFRRSSIRAAFYVELQDDKLYTFQDVYWWKFLQSKLETSLDRLWVMPEYYNIE